MSAQPQHSAGEQRVMKALYEGPQSAAKLSRTLALPATDIRRLARRLLAARSSSVAARQVRADGARRTARRGDAELHRQAEADIRMLRLPVPHRGRGEGRASLGEERA